MASGKPSTNSTFMQTISQHITCSICLEHFTNPKMTPCCHNFCQECLRTTIQNYARRKEIIRKDFSETVRFTFPCPSCRSEVEFSALPPQTPNVDIEETAATKAAEEFKTNFYIASQVDAVKKEIEHGCVEHHGETLLFFCMPCDARVCQLCIANDHAPPMHEICLFKNLKEVNRTKLMNSKACFGKRKQELEGTFQKAQTQLESLHEDKTHAKLMKTEVGHLMQQVESISKMLATIQNQALKQVQTLSAKELSILQKYQEIEENIEQCTEKMDQIDHILAGTYKQLIWTAIKVDSCINLPKVPTLPDDHTALNDRGCTEEQLKKILTDMEEAKHQLQEICTREGCPEEVTDEQTYDNNTEKNPNHPQVSDAEPVTIPCTHTPQPGGLHQKQVIGERLYPIVSIILEQIHGTKDIPGKITGMLLELDCSELFDLLADQRTLFKKVTEALDVLRAHHCRLLLCNTPLKNSSLQIPHPVAVPQQNQPLPYSYIQPQVRPLPMQPIAIQGGSQLIPPPPPPLNNCYVYR